MLWALLLVVPLSICAGWKLRDAVGDAFHTGFMREYTRLAPEDRTFVHISGTVEAPGPENPESFRTSLRWWLESRGSRFSGTIQ